MPKCTINGKEVVAREGATIIEAIKENDMDIAHYCWHPGLSIAGVCRLCMVQIEGNPRLQIACNTLVTEGMVINNTSPVVEDAVKWGLDFHLINHPLDCPICDQAGECGLQEQYMKYGQYDSEMAERKVKKRKVVDLGPKIVLDTERCILCSRCVRFTDEVSKTKELGIFNRGDRSEVGTFDDKPLDNPYSVNTVDICPVGALTSKDFRFRQRVWYLKEQESICTGCSTGCSTKVYHNQSGVYRVKPRFNQEVNGYWMCDEGRNTYKFTNKEQRNSTALVAGIETPTLLALGQVASLLKEADKSSVAVVLTGQYSVEEYQALEAGLIQKLGIKKTYYWQNNSDSFETFDGLLIRGDKNPNTAGLRKMLEKNGGIKSWSASGAFADGIKTVLVFAPENKDVYPDLEERAVELKKFAQVIWFSATHTPAFKDLANVIQIPMKTYVEKSGTFINYAGKEQKFKKALTVIKEAVDVIQAVEAILGQSLNLTVVESDPLPVDHVTKERRVKNEFLYRRGAL